eukprot:3323859-Pleurochrysis_carterae.AAC.5
MRYRCNTTQLSPRRCVTETLACAGCSEIGGVVCAALYATTNVTVGKAKAFGAFKLAVRRCRFYESGGWMIGWTFPCVTSRRCVSSP